MKQEGILYPNGPDRGAGSARFKRYVAEMLQKASSAREGGLQIAWFTSGISAPAVGNVKAHKFASRT